MAHDGDGVAPLPGIDLDALRPYFDEHVAALSGPLRASLLPGGRSNLTYRVSDDQASWVLRRPPLGELAPTANDVGREHHVMAGLHGSSVPVPEPLAWCPDPSLIGAPFSVVAMVEGHVVRSAADGAALTPDDARRCTDALVEVLAELHAVDPAARGLGDLGRPEGFLARQVRRWSGQWALVSTRPLPSLDHLLGELAAAVPATSAASVVHGDYRIDNTILDPHDAGRVAAVVDWEMATLGDPLLDVALLAVYWDERCGPVLPGGSPVAANPGFPTPDDVVDRYARASGRDLGSIVFHRALAWCKLAVIAEGIHHRHLAGDTVGEGFGGLGEQVPVLVEAGWSAWRRGSAT